MEEETPCSTYALKDWWDFHTRALWPHRELLRRLQWQGPHAYSGPFRHTPHTFRSPIGGSTEGSSGRVRMRTRVHLGTPLKRSLAAQSHCPRPGHCALHGRFTAEFRLAPSGPAAQGRGCELSWIYPTEDSQAPLFLLLLSLPSSSCSAAHSAFAIAFPHQFRVVRVRAH